MSTEIDNNTIKARHYSQDREKLVCQLCPHECRLSNLQVGLCKTRQNIDGVLIANNYGNLCAFHIDPIEKKPLYHFSPATKTLSIAAGGCNLSCLNCQNWEISQSSPDKVSRYTYTPKQIVDYALKHKCHSISYTYTEPVVNFEFVYDTAVIAKRNNIKNVIVTSGYINEQPLRELLEVIDAANVDLKCFDRDIYKELSNIKFENVLSTLELINRSNIWLEITNLLIPEWTDNMEMIHKMCNWLHEKGFENVPIHFSRFVPSHNLLHIVSTPEAVIHEAIKIAFKSGLKYVYSGNLMSDKYENSYCPQCHELLISRVGYQIINNRVNNEVCSNCGEHFYGRW